MPIVVTLDGIIIELNEKQFSKQLLLIAMIPCGIIIEVKYVHPAKQFL